MRVNNTNSLWDWYLRQNSNSKTTSKSNSISSQINLNSGVKWDKSESLQNAKFAEIRDKLSRFESIEPATFEEFQNFARVEWGMNVDREKYDYHRHNGRTKEQAVKDRDVALEKWANGETLSEAERSNMSMFGAYSRDESVSDAKRSLTFEYKRMNKSLEDNGITFKDGETFNITLSSPGGKAIISGIEDKEKLKQVEEIINENLNKKLWVMYGNSVISYLNVPESERFMSRAVGGVENYLEKYTNGSVRLEDLSIEDNGEVLGLPNELSEIINSASTSVSENPNTELRETKIGLNLIIPFIKKNGMDALPRHNYYFEFGNGKLTSVDMYS